MLKSQIKCEDEVNNLHLPPVSQERLMDEGIEDDDSGEEGGGGPDEQAQAAAAAAVPEPSFLSTAWSFISTFFTSLIPEGRPQPAN